MAQEEAWWEPLLYFAVHVAVAVAIFVLFAIPAVLLEQGVNWLGENGVGDVVLASFRLVEYTILGLDTLLVVIFVFRATWKAIKKVWK